MALPYLSSRGSIELQYSLETGLVSVPLQSLTLSSKASRRLRTSVNGCSISESSQVSFTFVDYSSIRQINAGTSLRCKTRNTLFSQCIPFLRGEASILRCSSSIGELANAAALEWKPAVDNLLLVSSIALAYLAGIITPAAPVTFAPAINIRRKNPRKRTSVILNDSQEMQDEHSHNDEHAFIGGAIHNKISKCVNTPNLLPQISGECWQISLQAIGRCPRLQLLLLALEELNKQICKMRQNGGSLESDWTKNAVEMLCSLVIPVCKTWVCEEPINDSYSRGKINMEKLGDEVLIGLAGSNGSTDSKVKLSKETVNSQWNSAFNSYLENFEGKVFLMRRLQATGKVELYADYLYFVCFRSPRYGSVCSIDIMEKHYDDLLEDILISVADSVAALYLEVLSAGNMVLDSEWSNIDESLISSTRMLERFRNEVALHSWISNNFQSVTAMFEDRFDLWTLKTCYSEKDEASKRSNRKHVEKRERIKSLDLVLSQSRIPVRRMKELRSLSGWRYYYSLYLEFSDIAGPLLKTIVAKLSEGISFLLVILIGRSLGLIYRGIQQSVQWTSK